MISNFSSIDQNMIQMIGKVFVIRQGWVKASKKSLIWSSRWTDLLRHTHLYPTFTYLSIDVPVCNISNLSNNIKK